MEHLNLTIEELSKINTVRVNVEDMSLEAPTASRKPLLQRTDKELPLEHKAASESFLVAEMEGRARLSKETRLREEKRLALRQRKRKRHTGASRGRRHWKRKQQTKEKALDRAYDRNPYEWFKRSCGGPVDITQEEWDRYLQEVFENHPRKSLVWKKHRWGRNFNVYSLILHYQGYDARGKPKPLQLVYDGESYIFQDVCNPEIADRVYWLTSYKP